MVAAPGSRGARASASSRCGSTSSSPSWCCRHSCRRWSCSSSRARRRRVIAPFLAPRRRHVRRAARDDGERSSQRQARLVSRGLLDRPATRHRDHRSLHPRDVWIDARLGTAQRRVVRRGEPRGGDRVGATVRERLRVAVVLLRGARERRHRAAPALRQEHEASRSRSSASEVVLRDGLARRATPSTRIEYIAELRVGPSSPSTWAACQLRSTPSKRPPIRSIARRERSLRSSVLRSSRRTSQTSKAWVIMSNLASVLAAVRCAVGGEEGTADLDGVGILALEEPSQREEPRHADDLGRLAPSSRPRAPPFPDRASASSRRTMTSIPRQRCPARSTTRTSSGRPRRRAPDRARRRSRAASA